MTASLRAVAATLTAHLKQQVVSPFAYLNIVVYPLIVTTIAIVLLGGSGRIVYATIGGGLTGLWALTLIDAGSGINSERWSGTLEQVLASPAGLRTVVLGKTLAAILMGLLAFAVSTGLSLAWVHRLPAPALRLQFAVSCGLTILSFFCLGMLLAPLFALGRWIFPFANAAEQLVYLLAGFMFPVTVLPGWVQPFTWLLAPSWAIRGVFSAAGADPPGDFRGWWLAALLISAAYLVLSVPLHRLVDHRARVTGQLALA